MGVLGILSLRFISAGTKGPLLLTWLDRLLSKPAATCEESLLVLFKDDD
jgi:hypothetical protein